MSKDYPMSVGITGGIGAGKTIVSKVFSILQIPVYNADIRAKWLMQHHEPLKLEIAQQFGSGAYHSDGEINRQFLAIKVFADKEQAKIINGLVHPVVREDFRSWLQLQSAPYVLKEAALLFETGSYLELDKIIHVTAPEKTRISRVELRDPQRSKQQIKQIIHQQLTDDVKNKWADFVIKNNDSELVIPQVLRIHGILTNS
ncbi:MAG: dephospho-CoA kinase [Cyclobacteriaceae bacterium]